MESAVQIILTEDISKHVDQSALSSLPAINTTGRIFQHHRLADWLFLARD